MLFMFKLRSQQSRLQMTTNWSYQTSDKGENFLVKKSKDPKLSFHSATRPLAFHSCTRLCTSKLVSFTVKYGAPWSKTSSRPSSECSLAFQNRTQPNRNLKTDFKVLYHEQPYFKPPLRHAATWTSSRLENRGGYSILGQNRRTYSSRNCTTPKP